MQRPHQAKSVALRGLQVGWVLLPLNCTLNVAKMVVISGALLKGNYPPFPVFFSIFLREFEFRKAGMCV